MSLSRQTARIDKNHPLSHQKIPRAWEPTLDSFVFRKHGLFELMRPGTHQGMDFLIFRSSTELVGHVPPSSALPNRTTPKNPCDTEGLQPVRRRWQHAAGPRDRRRRRAAHGPQAPTRSATGRGAVPGSSVRKRRIMPVKSGRRCVWWYALPSQRVREVVPLGAARVCFASAAMTYDDNIKSLKAKTQRAARQLLKHAG